MKKCISNIKIYIIVFSLSICRTFAAENDMGGLYLGLGANVGYDEYDATANVGYKGVKNIKVENTVNTEEVSVNDGIANNLVTQLLECGKTGEPQDIYYDEGKLIVSSKKDSQEVEVHNHGEGNCADSCKGLIEVYSQKEYGTDMYDLVHNESVAYLENNGKYELADSSATGYYYEACGEQKDNKYPVKVYKGIPKSDIHVENYNIAMSQSLQSSGHNGGGEMKMAYFHDFGNNLVAGVDLTGSLMSKNQRNVQASKFHMNDIHPDLTLSYNTADSATFTYNEGSYSMTSDSATITPGSTLTLSSSLTNEEFKSAIATKNPGVHIESPPSGSYLDVSNKDKDVSFEKGIFNPKLAFVVGGTYKGWFAGVRAGVSYNTGKVKTPDMTTSKSVSVASPLVGVQVMKNVSKNTNLYVTADLNIGDMKKSVNMNGIKSFKQSSYNVSAGVQWRCNFLK